MSNPPARSLPFGCGPRILIRVPRNIVTYHAEDGSGIGSAIVAAMTKFRKEAQIYPNL